MELKEMIKYKYKGAGMINKLDNLMEEHTSIDKWENKKIKTKYFNLEKIGYVLIKDKIEKKVRNKKIERKSNGTK